MNEEVLQLNENLPKNINSTNQQKNNNTSNLFYINIIKYFYYSYS